MAVMDSHRVLELHKAEEDAERRFRTAMESGDAATARKAADEWTTASRAFADYVLKHIEPYQG